MQKTWSEIVQYFRNLRDLSDDDSTRNALGALEALAAHIGEGQLTKDLSGWTSMTALCIQQVDVPPYSGPHLRVSPQSSGAIEFRYLDTAIEDRQWTRQVPPEGAIGRFDAFLDELNWIAD